MTLKELRADATATISEFAAAGLQRQREWSSWSEPAGPVHQGRTSILSADTGAPTVRSGPFVLGSGYLRQIDPGQFYGAT